MVVEQYEFFAKEKQYMMGETKCLTLKNLLVNM